MSWAFLRRRQRSLAVVALGLALAACSSTTKPKPTPLEAFEPKLQGHVVWSQHLGGRILPSQPSTKGEVFTVASSNGTVAALDVESGREVWRADAGDKLSAGAGSDGRYASVVTIDNELVTFDQGKPIWRLRLGSKVVTPPLVAGERVFVQGVDRAVLAFDAQDGRKLWVMQRQGDPLALSQPGVLTSYRDTLLAGQGAKLVGIDPLLGTQRFELGLASPRGTNEVERLADLVGPAARADDTVCARAFQAAVACVNAERASVMWSKTVSGYQGVSADTQFVFGADANDRITAWQRASGEVAWTSERLLHRGLSAPLALGRAVVFGDAEGYVHFLSREDGQTLMRVPTDGSAIVGAPLRSGATVAVLTANGAVYAIRPE
ncbi:MAG TPA: outer membrane protein assembly factor BamB [Methylibium sp.]